MREWCAELAALLDAEGCGRAVVGGHCLGANIALHFAARHPGRTAGLVLIEPMPPEALVGTMRHIASLRNFLLLFVKPVLWLNWMGIHRRRVAPMNLEEWDRAAASGELPLSRFASPLLDLRSTPTAAYLQGLAAVGEPLPALGEIRCPALVLMSKRSTMTDAAATRSIMRAMPQAEIVDIDARHWIPTEQPDAMRAAIEAWLASRKDPERAA